ncbi:cation channel sperm-associated auxiliary subunit gamma [Sphaerodactylus townsendi]|uniref:cation channel sperm-associated auxiliary subunit gamma n=1 Tax=Sphaerodactylus townsendi TaxID=933632 RepID=UPI002026A54C|nr:cation channel sperm-associated auxiliary subunit gamma [Sphaerodactylus townsendi]
MRAAPFQIRGKCESEEVCRMCWFTPMPMMNGSVVMEVFVDSNGLGILVEDKRFSINVNGFAKFNKEKGEIVYTIGTKLPNLKRILSLKEVSRPLWATYDQAPVVIIGQVPGWKVILLSDTQFDDFLPVEVSIDSCWIGSISCPQANFSSAIADTISTESTLFIRQNQLVYYFTGSYSALHMKTTGSRLWTRILNNICVKQLNPVHFSRNNSEYVIALGGGWQEGEFFLITVRDGIVKASGSLKTKNGTVCSFLQSQKCSILWVIFVTITNEFMLLVKDLVTGSHYVVAYYRGQRKFELRYQVPRLVPKGSDKGFVMLLGTEHYTNRTLVPRGLTINPLTMTLYIWGNVILQSHDMVNYIYLSSFPSTSYIKYFVHSYRGQFACVTDKEEIWVSIEGSSFLIRVYPSKPWNLYRDLQIITQSPDYEDKEATISVFYDQNELKQLLYLEDEQGNGRVIKRKVPLHAVLTYRQLITAPYRQITYDEKEYIQFTHRCPFSVLRILDQPPPQRYTRMEHYSAQPPDVMDPTKFHNPKSLAVYQGLIFQLLWLHSAYNRPYADPVHDPTWRWWKNKEQDADYYFYVAGNRKSPGGVYVNMDNYVKIYNLQAQDELPPKIYLDKKDTYTFFVFLSIRTAKQSLGETAAENSLSSMWVTVVLSHPTYFTATLERKELISRGSVLYEVTVADTGLFPNQDLSGKHLLKGSIILKSMGSYVFKIVGGGPFSQSKIRHFTKQEIVSYNSVSGSKTESLIWLREDSSVNHTDADGFHILSGTKYGITFVCQRKSACYDIVPRDMSAPDYFFVVRVSNRYVDQTTYCDYALEFIIHVHGLRLSPTRAIFLMKVSLFSLVGLVFMYMFILIVGPGVKKWFHGMYRKMEEAIAFRAESSLTFGSSLGSQTSLSMRASISDHSSSSPSPSVHEEKQ